jgi:hypothetical protein
MAEEVPAFVPRWLYHPERDAELVETPEQYAALMAQGTWADTPAAFGKITAPNREQMALQPQAVAPGAPLSLTEALVLQLQTQLTTQQADLATLQTQVVGLQQRLDAFTARQEEADAAASRAPRRS